MRYSFIQMQSYFSIRTCQGSIKKSPLPSSVVFFNLHLDRTLYFNSKSFEIKPKKKFVSTKNRTIFDGVNSPQNYQKSVNFF